MSDTWKTKTDFSVEAISRATLLGETGADEQGAQLLKHYYIAREAMICLRPLLSPINFVNYRKPERIIRAAVNLSNEFVDSDYFGFYIKKIKATAKAAGRRSGHKHLIWKTISCAAALLFGYKAILVVLNNLSMEEAHVHALRVFGGFANLAKDMARPVTSQDELVLAVDKFLITTAARVVQSDAPLIDFTKLSLSLRSFRFLFKRHFITASTTLLLPASTWEVMERASRKPKADSQVRLRNLFIERLLKEYTIIHDAQGGIQEIQRTLSFNPEHHVTNNDTNPAPTKKARMTLTTKETMVLDPDDITTELQRACENNTGIVSRPYRYAVTPPDSAEETLNAVTPGYYNPPVNTSISDNMSRGPSPVMQMACSSTTAFPSQDTTLFSVSGNIFDDELCE